MKKVRFSELVAAALVVSAVTIASATSPDLVISQVYGGGGAANSAYSNDFVELYNRGTAPVDFAAAAAANTTYTLQYSAVQATSWTPLEISSGSIQPGHYYLIALSPGTGLSGVLPWPAADTTGTVNIDNQKGKVAIEKGGTAGVSQALSGNTNPPTVPIGGVIVDLFGYGYGTTTNVPGSFEGTFAASGTGVDNKHAFVRFQETDNNAADFFVGNARARTSGYVPPINNGSADGTVTVSSNGTGDYTSLYAAAADLTQAWGGINASWTIRIASDLNEPLDIEVGPRLLAAGKTVTVKPAPGQSPVVTFTNTVASGGQNANLYIGANSRIVINDPNLTKLDGFTIDGSNNGTESRNLTIQNVAGVGSNYVNPLVRVVGDSDNVVIKNTILRNFSTNSATQEQPAVSIDSRRSTSDFVPDGFVIDNNSISSSASINGIGVRTDLLGTTALTAGQAQRGAVITRNTIVGAKAAIKLGQTAGGTITSNTITTAQGAADTVGILHSGANSATTWTLVVAGNTINSLQTATVTASTGATGIALSASAVSPSTYRVFNNIISGFSFNAPVSNPYYRGIVVTDPVASAQIAFNSINLPTSANISGATAANTVGIGILNSAFTGTADIRGNIVRLPQTGGSAVSVAGGIAGVTATENDWSAGAGAYTGTLAGSNAAGLADWQTLSGKDAASTAADPTVANPPASGTWVSATDLHFTADPGTSFRATPVTDISYDLDGDVRTALQTTKGVDEKTARSGIAGWQAY